MEPTYDFPLSDDIVLLCNRRLRWNLRRRGYPDKATAECRAFVSDDPHVLALALPDDCPADEASAISWSIWTMLDRKIGGLPFSVDVVDPLKGEAHG